MECAKDEKCIQIFQLPPLREFFMSARRAAPEDKGERAKERDECVAHESSLKQIHAIKIVAPPTKSIAETRKININSHSETSFILNQTHS
jgi:hypothetical protein